MKFFDQSLTFLHCCFGTFLQFCFGTLLHSCFGTFLQSALGSWAHCCLGIFSQVVLGICKQKFLRCFENLIFYTWMHSSLGKDWHSNVVIGVQATLGMVEHFVTGNSTQACLLICLQVVVGMFTHCLRGIDRHTYKIELY